MSSVLITGGAGFIGSHLVEKYAADGHQVAVLDDLSTGRVSNLDAARKAHPGRVEIVISDVGGELLEPMVAKADVVVHLAATVGVKKYVREPVRTIENNLHGTEAVLRAAFKFSKKVLLASTSEVYGCSTNLPFRPDDVLPIGTPLKTRWSYACSKLMDEFMAMAYHFERKLPVVVVRLFNTVGARQTGRYGMVLPTFVRQALAGRDITVYGTGHQKRCFGHVFDVVGAIKALAETPAAVGGIFNIGSQEEVSIMGLAEKVKAMIDSTSRIVFVPYQEAYGDGFEDIPRRIPDLTLTSQVIGYKPTLGLEQSIQAVIDHQRLGSENA